VLARGGERKNTALAGAHTGSVASKGTVREWSDDRGMGVIDSADTPGGCWVHFSHVVTDGLGSLRPGDQVMFTYEALPQDEFNYLAVLVWPPGVSPETPPRARHHDGPSAAYQSRLTIRWSDGTVTEGIPDQKRHK
jgi:CspA family cold shock protein